MKTKKYIFKSKLWKYKGPAGWHFLTLPIRLTLKIRRNHGLSEEGWGRLPVVALTGNSSWKTAIWYDSKAKSYLLPIKMSIRRAQKLEIGSLVKITLVLNEEDFAHLSFLNRNRD